jgi:hypothetical protein
VGQLLDTIMHGNELPKPELAQQPPEYVPYEQPARDNNWMIF